MAMDAIHIMLGQNGRSGRPDTAPQTTATDLGAAFSRALAALEGGTPKETGGEVEAQPEEDGAATEEATAEEDASADGETSAEGDLPAEGTPLEDAENGAPASAEPIEEEFLPLVLGKAAATAAPADGAAESQAPKARSGPPNLQALVPAETGPQALQASLDPQHASAALTGAAASEASSAPASPAQTSALAQANVMLPAIPREGASLLSRGTAIHIPATTDAEQAFDAAAIAPEGEITDVRVAPKAAGIDRHIAQNEPTIAFPTTPKAAAEVTAEDSGMRLQADAVNMVQIEPGASPSRSTPTALFAPTAEARPVLNSIVEATVKAQNGTIELRLSPEELGRVRISMSHHEQGISVVLNVEREDTLHLLRRHASELAAALREAGLGEATIEFANRDQRPPPDAQRQTPRQAFGVFSNAGPEIDRPVLRPSGDGGLDIRM
ncbi:Flagellar hook-length control protein FliK [Palleronia marisminoris]|uniref:Flagellar hook-length control protein FliK n=1 Tax=Palleronia marisminoris TaxID=315423 RepID=A0A1Y5SRI3_9RHOB|nr:flagellar hook-length control protein FliK [Palleronia marisminoris]SFG95069.1 Flagellar hook-length control protein FliK [Palleronia marisminoris]SLN46762.1 Flagellar hook-length control protein FliK [Palleronia marisminoris]